MPLEEQQLLQVQSYLVLELEDLDQRREAKPMAPFAASSIPLATLGVFILWLGWFGFNGGSQLAAGTLEDVSSVATIYINTNLAAGGGVLAAATVSRLIGGKTDVYDAKWRNSWISRYYGRTINAKSVGCNFYWGNSRSINVLLNKTIV